MVQDGQLFPQLTVARNVAYPLGLRRAGRERTRSRVADLLDLVGLSGCDDRLPGTLSGGERQRVALARALAVRPRLLLLDEPLSALDRGLREELAAQLHGILRAAGTTAVMVTHDQEEAFAVADRMAVMRTGRLVQEGSVGDLWANPADGWTAGFLGYASVLSGAAARVVRDVVDPAAGWTEVALRRSALRVADTGPLAGTVDTVRATPELTRLGLVVDGLGAVQGVAEPGRDVHPGQRVHLQVDPTRLAALRTTRPYTGSS
jgi:thiamine transport system ATP-binding protein